MRKLILAILITYFTTTTLAFARAQRAHATGNAFTQALNMAESKGMLNPLEPNSVLAISDMRVDMGQVFIVVEKNHEPSTIIYDMMSERITEEPNSQ